jgi:serine/threonine-protein kinase HipA
MSLNGKRDDFALDDFEAVGRAVAMKRGRAKAIVGEVAAAVIEWRELAEEAGVEHEAAERIAASHRRGPSNVTAT